MDSKKGDTSPDVAIQPKRGNLLNSLGFSDLDDFDLLDDEPSIAPAKSVVPESNNDSAPKEFEESTGNKLHHEPVAVSKPEEEVEAAEEPETVTAEVQVELKEEVKVSVDSEQETDDPEVCEVPENETELPEEKVETVETEAAEEPEIPAGIIVEEKAEEPIEGEAPEESAVESIAPEAEEEVAAKSLVEEKDKEPINEEEPAQSAAETIALDEEEEVVVEEKVSEEAENIGEVEVEITPEIAAQIIVEEKPEPEAVAEEEVAVKETPKTLEVDAVKSVDELFEDIFQDKTKPEPEEIETVEDKEDTIVEAEWEEAEIADVEETEIANQDEPEESAATVTKDTPLDLSCPSCEKVLSFKRAHIGTEGACVYCNTPIVARETEDGGVAIFEIKTPEIEETEAEESTEIVAEEEIEVIEEVIDDVEEVIVNEQPAEPDTEEFIDELEDDDPGEDAPPISIESLFADTKKNEEETAILEEIEEQEETAENSAASIESLFEDDLADAKEAKLESEPPPLPEEEQETPPPLDLDENEEAESTSLNCPTCHAELLMDMDCIGVEGECVECGTPIVAHQFDNGEIAVVRISNPEDETEEKLFSENVDEKEEQPVEAEAELPFEEEPQEEQAQEEQAIYIDPVAEVTSASSAPVSLHEPENDPLFPELEVEEHIEKEATNEDEKSLTEETLPWDEPAYEEETEEPVSSEPSLPEWNLDYEDEEDEKDDDNVAEQTGEMPPPLPENQEEDEEPAENDLSPFSGQSNLFSDLPVNNSDFLPLNPNDNPFPASDEEPEESDVVLDAESSIESETPSAAAPWDAPEVEKDTTTADNSANQPFGEFISPWKTSESKDDESAGNSDDLFGQINSPWKKDDEDPAEKKTEELFYDPPETEIDVGAENEQEDSDVDNLFSSSSPFQTGKSATESNSFDSETIAAPFSPPESTKGSNSAPPPLSSSPAFSSNLNVPDHSRTKTSKRLSNTIIILLLIAIGTVSGASIAAFFVPVDDYVGKAKVYASGKEDKKNGK